MEWTITIHSESGYAEIVTRGVADKAGSIAMVKACLEKFQTSRIKKILIDHRNISAVSGTVVDIYHRPKEMANLGVNRDIRIAEIVMPEHSGFFTFLETVCKNRGFLFSVFTDRNAALNWLLKPE